MFMVFWIIPLICQTDGWLDITATADFAKLENLFSPSFPESCRVHECMNLFNAQWHVTKSDTDGSLYILLCHMVLHNILDYSRRYTYTIHIPYIKQALYICVLCNNYIINWTYANPFALFFRTTKLILRQL